MNVKVTCVWSTRTSIPRRPLQHPMASFMTALCISHFSSLPSPLLPPSSLPIFPFLLFSLAFSFLSSYASFKIVFICCVIHLHKVCNSVSLSIFSEFRNLLKKTCLLGAFLTFVCFTCVCVFLLAFTLSPHACGVNQIQKRMTDPLKLEVHTIVSHPL